MSFQTIVRGGLVGLLRIRRDLAPPAAGADAVTTPLSISSMRILETSLALSAIATALLIGLGR